MNAASQTKGKLRIGDDWNAITIIALSQSNPLKAVAEFVENSIDAGATEIEIIRGREKTSPICAFVITVAASQRTIRGYRISNT